MESRSQFGEGITGWAALHREPVRTNQAHLDPRTKTVPGTPPDEPEALITVPLIARDVVKGVLNIYRLGEHASFSDEEFELATRFADAAALALDNAQIRARLEYQAQTDSLTGLYNHRYFHDRLRSELTRASRSRDAVAVLMLDIDDFKRVNDVYGHGAGDHVLTELAVLLRNELRGSDVVCRLGGEEFGVIMASADAGDALNLGRRLTDTLAETEFAAAGKITISVGISQGPEHAMNPRELVACSEAAMMTAKARGKNQIVLFDEETSERPEGVSVSGRDVRSIAHLKMLQSLAGKLNRLNDVRQIGAVIADELRLLIDYHNCRVSVIDGDDDRSDRLPRRARLARRRACRPASHQDRRGHHGTGGHDGRAAARRQHARVRLRGHDPRHAHDRRVARGRAALLRHSRDRRDRDVEARHRPVRRGRRAAARGARRARLGRARERSPLRVPAARGRPPEGAARVHGRDHAGGDPGGDRSRDRTGSRPDARRQELRLVAAARERRLPDCGPLGLRRRPGAEADARRRFPSGRAAHGRR